MENGKIIAREVAPENTDFSWYFDNDGFSSRAGDQCYSVFVMEGNRTRGYNADEYKRIQGGAELILDEYNGGENTITQAVNYALYGKDAEKLAKNTHRLHLLKEWAKDADIDNVESMAEYLSILTGKNWATRAFCGYCQGDYCELLYCTDVYNEESITEFGNFWLGCGSEFVIDDTGGYFVIDTVRWHEGEELVEKLADMYGCNPEDMEVYLYDGEERIVKHKLLEIA